MKKNVTRLIIIGVITLTCFSGLYTQEDTDQGRELYRNPIAFARTHFNEKTGIPTHRGKIWIMEEDGSKIRQVTFGPQYDDHPAIFSDQHTILYSEFTDTDFPPKQDTRLIKLDINTGKREIYAEQKGCRLHHVTLSAKDDKLVYHHDCGKRNTQRVGWGADSYEITMRSANGIAIGESVIFMHEKNPGLKPREVALVRLFNHGEGAKAIFLTDDKHLHRRPAVSPNGEWLAWQTNMTGNDEIFLAQINGTKKYNITNNSGVDGHPWFSRDGKCLIFESDRTGNMEIWKLNLETLETKQLTFGGKKYASRTPRW
ncbi:MAG: hypothetical protein HKN87_18355 [Saprospiraceae bacterium]|nr:hypothetical protein [Saprospiraceae bacterium]